MLPDCNSSLDPPTKPAGEPDRGGPQHAHSPHPRRHCRGPARPRPRFRGIVVPRGAEVTSTCAPTAPRRHRHGPARPRRRFRENRGPTWDRGARNMRTHRTPPPLPWSRSTSATIPRKSWSHVGCDQAMLVRKERKVRSPSRNTEASSSGCESRPIRPARRVGSEPCDGHDGERAEAGRQRARRCVGTQTSELCDVSLETGDISSVQGIPCPEDHDIDLTRWHRRFDVLDGVAVHGAFEEDDPVTWDTRALGGDTGGRRRGRPKSGPACVAGVGGAL